MGRRAQGWRIKWKRGGPGKGVAHVRFTFRGKEIERSTGESDPRKASERAAQIYAEVVSGESRARADARRRDLSDITKDWIVDAAASPQQVTYATNWLAAFDPITKRHLFESLDSFKPQRVQRFFDLRLREVTGQTVRCEYYAMRQFVTWCHNQDLIDSLPEWPPPPAMRAGVRKRINRKAAPVDLAPEQVAAILAALPEWAEKGHYGRFRVRDRFIFYVETGLRDATVRRLVCPTHYYPGRETLLITSDLDKVKYARELPITESAREALDRACRDLGDKPGLIFGKRSFDALNTHLRAAALRAGLEPHLASVVSTYDLRHDRGRTLADGGAPVTAISYLLGHLRVSTTNRYVRPTQRAAAAALASIAPGIPDRKPDQTKKQPKTSEEQS